MTIIDGTSAVTERLTSPKYPGLYVQISKRRTEGTWFFVANGKRQRVGYWPDTRTGCAAMARAEVVLARAEAGPAPSPLFLLLTRSWA